MRAGGGKEKGSEWERQVGKQLSLWLTAHERPDIFSRNVLSGGSFTRAERLGEISSRMPGDLMAAHPLAIEFLKQFSVECKHLKDIGLEALLWDASAGTMLGNIIHLARRQAASIKCEHMVIAKQDRREPLVFVSGEIGHRFLAAKRPAKRVARLPMYHELHRQSIFVMQLRDMLVVVDPDILLKA